MTIKKHIKEKKDLYSKLKINSNDCVEIDKSNNSILNHFFDIVLKNEELYIVSNNFNCSVFYKKEKMIDFSTVEELFLLMNYLKKKNIY